MNDSCEVDVVIMGAGPAGLTAALRLRQLSYRVLVIERLALPRPQIGESLSPGYGNILEFLGATEILKRIPHCEASNSMRLWETRGQIDRGPRGVHTIVDRAQFDLKLLQLAAERGAQCWTSSEVISTREEREGCELLIGTPQGVRSVRASYLLDARGRNSARDYVPSAPLMAVWCDCPAGILSGETRLEALPNAWLWGSPLPDGRYRIMAYYDPSLSGKGDFRLVRVLESHIRESLLFGEAGSMVSAGDVNACGASAYATRHLWQGLKIKLGDAAFALDPLSSSGVERAMRFSLQAVIALHTVLSDVRDGALAKEYLERQLTEATGRHAAWTADAYASAWPASAQGFWRSRIESHRPRETQALTGAPEMEDESISLFMADSEIWRRILRLPVRIAPGLRFIDLPCVVGDRVRRYAAAHHPNLSRPVAFLNGFALEPLIGSLINAADIRQWLELSFESSHRFEGLRTVAWLLRHGLLMSDQALEPGSMDLSRYDGHGVREGMLNHG